MMKARLFVVGALALLMPGSSEVLGADAKPKEGREQYVRTTRAAVESVRRDLDGFRLSLEHHGPDPDKYHSVHLSVRPWPDKLPPSHVAVQIDKEQAAVIVGYLAVDGFLYRGAINRAKQLRRPEGPHYFLVLQVREGEQYFEFLPWATEPYRWHWMSRPPLGEQLDNLRAVLGGTAADAVDKLGRAVEAGHRGERKQPSDTP